MKRKGFTVGELLLAIAFVAIVAVVFPAGELTPIAFLMGMLIMITFLIMKDGLKATEKKPEPKSQGRTPRGFVTWELEAAVARAEAALARHGHCGSPTYEELKEKLKAIDDEREKKTNRSGFTLMELLPVIAIIAILFAAGAPRVLDAIADRQLVSAAGSVKQAYEGARDRAVRDAAFNPRSEMSGVQQGGTAGFRLIPDTSFELKRLEDGTIDPDQPLAFSKIQPLTTPDAYTEGRVTIVTTGYPDAFVKGGWQLPGRLILEEAIYDAGGNRCSPTSWYWNVRVGDIVRVMERPYVVTGPAGISAADGNSELFVNVGLPGAKSPLDRGDGPREFLYLVDRVDNNKDGIVDSGWNGLDDDYDGAIDEQDEWEQERWHGLLGSASTEVYGDLATLGLVASPYSCSRRPIATGKAVTLAAVIDATGWGGVLVDDPDHPGEQKRIYPRLRSRLPVNLLTGAVDLIVANDGSLSAPSIYGQPTPRPINDTHAHFWISAREDVLYPVQAKGWGKIVSINYRAGRAVAGDADPGDVDGTFARAEGRGR